MPIVAGAAGEKRGKNREPSGDRVLVWAIDSSVSAIISLVQTEDVVMGCTYPKT